MSGRGVARNVPLKSDNSPVATYKYDAAGNRVEKAVNGGATERYVLSRAEQTSNGIDCWHVIAVFDGSNNWKQNFVYRDEIDGIVALEQKDVLDFDTDGNTTEITRNFYHGNALGSVMAISDMTQATAVSYRYDPYGKVTITRGGQTQTSDPLGQHWGLTGRSLDEETGLWYYRARYYDPGTGRFTQRDPCGFKDAPSLFTYARNRPAVLVDPTGYEGFFHLSEGHYENLFGCTIQTDDGTYKCTFWIYNPPAHPGMLLTYWKKIGGKGTIPKDEPPPPSPPTVPDVITPSEEAQGDDADKESGDEEEEEEEWEPESDWEDPEEGGKYYVTPGFENGWYFRMHKRTGQLSWWKQYGSPDDPGAVVTVITDDPMKPPPAD